MSEFIVLILCQKPVSVGTLAAEIGIKLSAMSQRVNTLQAKGLLARVEAKDARTNTTQITTAGRSYLKSIIQKMMPNCQVTNLGLSSLELKQLTLLLAKINLPQIEVYEKN